MRFHIIATEIKKPIFFEAAAALFSLYLNLKTLTSLSMIRVDFFQLSTLGNVVQ